jgi:hypothetical protein
MVSISFTTSPMARPRRAAADSSTNSLNPDVLAESRIGGSTSALKL